MSLSDDALVTLDDFRALMKWPAESHADDVAIIESVIESVSAAISGSVDCLFIPEAAIAETKDGNGRSYLYLDNWPVTDVASVVEDDTTLTEDTDFYVDYANGILEKPAGYKWTTSKRGIVVTYDAGHEAVPADVKLACLVEAARKFGVIDKKMYDESSRTEEGVSITINTDELLPSTLETLARYRRVRI